MLDSTSESYCGRKAGHPKSTMKSVQIDEKGLVALAGKVAVMTGEHSSPSPRSL